MMYYPVDIRQKLNLVVFPIKNDLDEFQSSLLSK